MKARALCSANAARSVAKYTRNAHKHPEWKPDPGRGVAPLRWEAQAVPSRPRGPRSHLNFKTPALRRHGLGPRAARTATAYGPARDLAGLLAAVARQN